MFETILNDPFQLITFNHQELKDFADAISSQGLLLYLSRLKGHGMDKKENFKPTALLYACFSYLNKQRLAYINSIPVEPAISPELLTKEPLNNKLFLNALFSNPIPTTLRGTVVFNGIELPKPQTDDEIFEYWMKRIINIDSTSYLQSYYIYLIDHRKPIYFGHSLPAPIYWNSLFDFIIVKYPTIELSFEKIKTIHPLMKFIQVDKNYIRDRKIRLGHEIRKSMQSLNEKFYSPKYTMDENTFINEYQIHYEIIPKYQIKALLRAMFLVQPEPFDTISTRIIKGTFFTYSDRVIQRYAQKIATFIGYKKFSEYSEKDLDREFGWIPINYRSILNTQMKRLKKAYTTQETLAQLPDSLEKKLFFYTANNGCISICRMKDIFANDFASVDMDTLQRTNIHERHEIRPICPQQIANKFKQFEQIDVWMNHIFNFLIHQRHSSIIQILTQIGSVELSPQYLVDVLGKGENDLSSPQIEPIYILSIGKMDENGFPVGYKAIRIILDKIIKIQVVIGQNSQQVEFLLQCYEGRNVKIQSQDRLIGRAFFNFVSQFDSLFNYKIDMSPMDFFGFENSIFRSILSLTA